MTTLPSDPPPTAVAAVPAAISCHRVSVDFGSFRALHDVDLSWAPASINVVVGQNGAGKTTLARVLGGLQHPSEGTVSVSGAPLSLGDVQSARRRGVELVHQHFALPSSFTVAEALELFNTAPRRLGVFSRRSLTGTARAQLEAARIAVSPDARIGDLPVETLQALEITRALSSKPSVLVLDEPTAVLSPQAVSVLFDRLRELARTGICVVLVLHKLDEVMEIAETVAVLRAGELVMPPTRATSLERRELARMVVGGALAPGASRPRAPRSADPALELRDVSAASQAHDAPIIDLNLNVASGEIVGVAGIEGNGQRSLVEAIAGICSTSAGSMQLGAERIDSRPVRARRSAGLRVVPFERNTEGVSRTSALWENHALASAGERTRLVVPGVERQACRAALERWDVRFRSVDQPTGELSGGNVQKTILARELAGDVRCLVAAHPTRGLDIAATEAVRSAVAATADAGAAVLLVSADLDELMQLSHRLVVLCRGKVAGTFEPPYDLEAIGWAMTGGEDR